MHQPISTERASGEVRTISDLLFPVSDPELREQIETYRVGWEKAFGKTDVRLRYTSQLPAEERELLKQQDPQRYFDGLPPFMKDFIRGKMDNAKKNQHLDYMPTLYLQLYLSGGMRPSAQG